MMGGFGSYYSNLSASAQPFMVDRSAQKPSPTGFDDFFTESFCPPFIPSPPTTSMLNSQRFSFKEFEELASSDSHRSPAAQPYDPPYFSTEHEVLEASRFPGYYGSEGKNQAVSSLFENNICLRTRASLGSNKGENFYNNKMFTSEDNGGMILSSRDKNVAPAGTGQVNEKHPMGHCTNFLPTYKSNNSVFGSVSKFSDSYPFEAVYQSADSWNNEVSCNAFQEKRPNQHGVSHDMCFGKNMSNSGYEAEMKSEIHTPTAVTLPSLSSERKVCFNPTQTRIPLGENDYNFAKSILPESELPKNTNVCSDASENFFGAESFFQGLALGCEGVTNHVKNSFESLDHHHPTVDSPCWKGAPFSRCSEFEVSKKAGSEVPVMNSSKNPSRHSRPHGYLFLDHSLAYTSEVPSAPNLLFEEFESYGAKKAKSGNIESSDDVDEPSHKDSINEPDTKLCPISEQSLGEDVLLVSEKQSTVGAGSSNVRINASSASDLDPSHGPSIAKRDFSSASSSSHEIDPAKLSDLQDDLLPSKITFHSLVDTILNLSELLLCECKKEKKLKGQEFETLNKVMDNLDKCLVETAGENIKSGQSSSSQQAVTQSFTNLVSLTEETGAINSQAEEMADLLKHSVNKNAKVREMHCGGYYEAETSKDNRMTQGIKNILAQNFPDEEEIQPQVLLYKNLWLEAEAALCSTTFMVRFYRIKNEIERYKLPMRKENSTNTKSPSRPASFPKASTCDKSEPSMYGGQTTNFVVKNSPVVGAGDYENDVIAGLHVLKHQDRLVSESVDHGIVAESSEKFSVSPDPSTCDKSKPTMTEYQTTDFPDQNSLFIRANGYENDVMDRHHILKHRDLHSESVGGKGTEISESFLIAPDASMCDKSKPNMNGYQTTAFQDQNSPVIGPSGYENDIMARHHILKCRDRLHPESVDGTVVSKTLEGFSVSPDPSTCDKSKSIMKGHQKTDFAVKCSPVISADGNENDVMARFHILKRRGLHLDSVVGDMAENSESHSPSPNGKSEPNAVSYKATDIRAQDSTSTHLMDVADRFQVLKRRVNEPNSENVVDSGKFDQPLMEDKNSQTPGIRHNMDSWHLSIDSHPSGQPVLKHHNRSANIPGNELSPSVYESFSSDWEHVPKEELPEQNL